MKDVRNASLSVTCSNIMFLLDFLDVFQVKDAGYTKFTYISFSLTLTFKGNELHSLRHEKNGYLCRKAMYAHYYKRQQKYTHIVLEELFRQSQSAVINILVNNSYRRFTLEILYLSISFHNKSC